MFVCSSPIVLFPIWKSCFAHHGKNHSNSMNIAITAGKCHTIEQWCVNGTGTQNVKVLKHSTTTKISNILSVKNLQHHPNGNEQMPEIKEEEKKKQFQVTQFHKTNIKQSTHPLHSKASFPLLTISNGMQRFVLYSLATLPTSTFRYGNYLQRIMSASRFWCFAFQWFYFSFGFALDFRVHSI